MADDGWDSGGESSRPPPVHSATFSRGGGGQGRGYNQSGGGGRWNDRRNDGDTSLRGQGGGRDSNDGGRRFNDGGGRFNDGGGFRGRGRGRGGGSYGRGNRDEGTSTTSLYINSSDVGRIIGKGGSKIRELENDSGAEIKVNIVICYMLTLLLFEPEMSSYRDIFKTLGDKLF